jgi:hypothetical protein
VKAGLAWRRHSGELFFQIINYDDNPPPLLPLAYIYMTLPSQNPRSCGHSLTCLPCGSNSCPTPTFQHCVPPRRKCSEESRVKMRCGVDMREPPHSTEAEKAQEENTLGALAIQHPLFSASTVMLPQLPPSWHSGYLVLPADLHMPNSCQAL